VSGRAGLGRLPRARSLAGATMPGCGGFLEAFEQEVGKRPACLRGPSDVGRQLRSKLDCQTSRVIRKASVPDRDPSPSLAPFFSLRDEPKSSIRLPGLFPFSIIAASLVARLIKSGRLVRLPLASAARTASMSNFGGRLMFESRFGGRGEGEPVAARCSAGSDELAAA